MDPGSPIPPCIAAHDPAGRTAPVFIHSGLLHQEEEVVRDGHRLYTVIAAAYTGECLEPGPALLHIGRVSRGETAYLSRIRDRLLRQAAGLSRAEDLSRRREVEALRRDGRMDRPLYGGNLDARVRNGHDC